MSILTGFFLPSVFGLSSASRKHYQEIKNNNNKKKNRRNYPSCWDEVTEIIFNSLLIKLWKYTNIFKNAVSVIEHQVIQGNDPWKSENKLKSEIFQCTARREFPACSSEAEIFLCWGDGSGKEGGPRKLEKRAAQRKRALGIYRGFLCSLWLSVDQQMVLRIIDIQENIS